MTTAPPRMTALDCSWRGVPVGGGDRRGLDRASGPGRLADPAGTARSVAADRHRFGRVRGRVEHRVEDSDAAGGARWSGRCDVVGRRRGLPGRVPQPARRPVPAGRCGRRRAWRHPGVHDGSRCHRWLAGRPCATHGVRVCAGHGGGHLQRRCIVRCSRQWRDARARWCGRGVVRHGGADVPAATQPRRRPRSVPVDPRPAVGSDLGRCGRPSRRTCW